MVTKCQLRCIMCHFAHPEFRENPEMMGRELLERIAAEVFPIAHEVALSSSAEPLMAPELPYALELCRKYDLPAFHFSTNALSMTEKIMHTIIDVRMPWITISCDGATKATYERIRTPAKWEVFLKKIDLINEIKAKRGATQPGIGITYVLMRSNLREAPDMVRLAKKMAMGNVVFTYMGVIGGLGVEAEAPMNDPKLCNAMVAEAKAVGAELGIKVIAPMPIPESFGDAVVTDAARSNEGGGTAIQAPEDAAVSAAEFINSRNELFQLKAKKKRDHNRACYFPWYYIHINPDGTVFPCGCWFEFSKFGDFKTQSFREIWTGPKYKELRRQIYNMELRDVCANCSVSNMGRPDVRASFSHRAKVRRGDAAAAPKA